MGHSTSHRGTRVYNIGQYNSDMPDRFVHERDKLDMDIRGVTVVCAIYNRLYGYPHTLKISRTDTTSYFP